MYLDRCQVDTPDHLVRATWNHVHALRSSIGKVVDFGAGDGRFARYGSYREYVGYEIDLDRSSGSTCPPNARLVNGCAFSEEVTDADLCIGNPPFVRNQDLPEGWRQRASSVLYRRTGVQVSGLANAWQYFFLLSLASVKADGLVALVIPFEWVSRPSSRALRAYIESHGWAVSVYRLVDTTFDKVLTTSSITIIDKTGRGQAPRYFEETAQGSFTELASPSGSNRGVMPYLRRSAVTETTIRAVRGLSPGTQEVLTLTEGERARFALSINQDVVRCITTLRHLPQGEYVLDEDTFRRYYRDSGRKCWLIRTDRVPSRSLQAYLDSIPEGKYNTSTCRGRQIWWKFVMPPVPDVLMATGFKGSFPKAVRNSCAARAVGAVCGIYNASEEQTERLTVRQNDLDIRDRIVAHANGLRKVEINQLNSFLLENVATVSVVP